MVKGIISAKASGTLVLGGDLTITRLGFGAMRLTGKGIIGPPKNPEEAKAVLRRAIELGINFIDTAWSYGPEISENLIAEVLYPYPADLVIATKGGLRRPGPDQWEPDGSAAFLRSNLESSLRRLKLERIDLYQLHRIDPKVPVEESLGLLKEFQQQGKIRHIGLSEVSVDEIEKCKKIVKIVSTQNLYNISNRQGEPVVQYCEKNKLGFIPWFPLASGDLAKQGGELEQIATTKGVTVMQLAIAWLLKHSPVIIPIPGTSSVKHLEENVAAASIELNQQELAQLDRLFKK